MKPTVALVHWNRPTVCAGAVALFVRQTVPCRVVVYDNASSVAARQELDQRLRGFPEVTIVWLESNLGFAGAAAAAIAGALGDPSDDCCVVATHDAVPGPDAVEKLTTALRANEDLAVVFSRCEVEHEGRWSALRGSRLPEGGAFPGKGLVRGLYFGSACWAIARRAFERGVSVDPRIFLYGEECDLGLAARRAGLTTALHTEVMVWNGEFAGVGNPDLIAYLSARNSVLLARKHAGRAVAVLRATGAGVAAALRATVSRTEEERRLARWRLRGSCAGLAGKFGSPPAELLQRPADGIDQGRESGVAGGFEVGTRPEGAEGRES